MNNTELRHHCYAMGYSDGEVGAFYDGYEKGIADALENKRYIIRSDGSIHNLDEEIEKARADGIEECIKLFKKMQPRLATNVLKFGDMLEQLKEQNNEKENI